jgi:DUF917 family protein
MTRPVETSTLRRTQIALEDLEAFGLGACLLGAGGGGDPYVGRLILERELRDGKSLTIIELDALDDEALVVPVCLMGAPTVMIEKVPSVEALEIALQAMEKRLGRKADALIPLEIGGINSTVPLVLGARLGLPVVNADGMGRAFPEIQMVTFGIYGNDISPIVLVNEAGHVVEVTSQSNLAGERLGRSIVAEMGGTAHVALYPMTGAQVKATAIPDTLTLALDIGWAMLGAGDASAEQNLIAALGSLDQPRKVRVLFEGKVADVRRETKGGFNVGNVVIERLRGSSEKLEVVFQNENLVAYLNGAAIATTPDIITVVDSETAEPITTEGLKFGQRVKVLGISVPPMMCSDEALAVVGPRAFGLDLDYVPWIA